MEPKTCPHPTCGHIWTPRKANPKKCPQCQNPLWRSSRPKKKRIRIGDAIQLTTEEVKSLTDGSPPSSFIEKDRLSDAKARAEELMRKLI